MAKWGEGDPRWIVEERPDATNVNNWHWTEKNATPWSKTRLTELLKDLTIEGPDALETVKVTEILRMDGEATANNRKAKLIFLFEWEIKCKWEGFAGADGDKVEGELEIPNLSDENEAHEVDVNVTCKTSSDAGERFRTLMLTKGVERIKELMGIYISELKQEFSKGLILPTKGNTGGPINSVKPPKDEIVLNPVFANKHDSEKAKSITKSSGVAISTRSLHLKETFKCRATDLFSAFTRPEMVEAFSHGPAQCDPVKGGKFKLYGGMVEGQFLDLKFGELVVMLWRLRRYPDGHFSMVSLRFKEKKDCTELELEQSQVPDSDFDDTEDGWKRHYFEAVKRTFGFGAQLF